jgi:crotonobetainyl-CoA:carnitine CoA-transferase CaiB-like acyl-CoA transferase
LAGPLDGVTILDCTTVVLGPWAGQQLGDLGADVIKIEPPEGDSARQVGPAKNPNMAALFLGSNRNKRSLVLDLKQKSGIEALYRMAERADVLMHNLRPGPAGRLGLQYADLEKINPRLIYIAAYGYRAAGPMGDKPAYDDIIQAAAGLAHLQTAVAGEPRYVPTVVADKTGSGAVVTAVLAALYEREKSGRGQAVEVTMFEALVSYLMAEHLYGAAFLPQEHAAGYTRVLHKERRPFATRDGYIALTPYTDANWRELCDLVGRPDVLEDPCFASLAIRINNVAHVNARLGEICATRTTDELMSLLKTSNVPHGPVNSMEDLLTNEQLLATGYWKEFDHPSEGRIRSPDVASTFSRTPGSIQRLQPRLGEHSVEILGEFGLAPDEIERLVASGVTRTS